MIAVLDACLVNGWGLITLDSLVVTSNVAVATKSTGCTYDVGAVVLVAGATPSGLNGEHKVTATTANSVSFATTGIADGTATGTITLKLAPAGWAKTYSGTNLAAYKPTDVTATGCLLRVDDTAAQTTRVVGYETMSDVNTGTGVFPTATQRTGGTWWTKSSTATSAARSWYILSDGRMFYFIRYYHATYSTHSELTCFGDMIPTKTSDAYSCCLFGIAGDSTSTPATTSNCFYYSTASATDLYCPRSYTGIGTSQQMRKLFPCISIGTDSYSGQLTLGMPFPNPGDGGLYVVPMYISEHVSFNFRGVTPGFYACPQNVAITSFNTGDSVSTVTGLSGKKLKAFLSNNATYSVYSTYFIDITGPWR
jgi:hypothetical protein